MDPPRHQTFVHDLEGELQNFADIARSLRPTPADLPSLDGIEVAGFTLPLRGDSGGDHIIYIDFDRRCDLPARIVDAQSRGRVDIATKLQENKDKAGILIADVSGHKTTDAFLAGMLHQAFLTGVLYELEDHGAVTPRLFEHLSVRFHDSMPAGKFITVLYGEIDATGRFRFISAGHQSPVVFSHRYGCFTEISPATLYQCPPLGMMPFEHIDRTRRPHPIFGFKRRYEVNVLDLMGSGDMLLLCTDGVTDHAVGTTPYMGPRLEAWFRAHEGQPLDQLAESLAADLGEFGPLQDDASIVIVRKTP